MGDQFTWRLPQSGAWGLAANWADVTAADNPALVPPGSQDSATISGPADGATFYAVSGPGSAASFTNTGNVALSGGTFTFGALNVGSTATAAFLDIVAGTSVNAESAPTLTNPLQATGAGAALTIGGTVTLDAGSPFSVLNASNGASVSLGGLSLQSYSAVTVDPTATIEIGPGGGSPAAGAITVDAGVSVVAAGSVLTDNTLYGALADNGFITVGGGSANSYLTVTGAVTGSGTLTIAANGDIGFGAGDAAAIAFSASNATLNFAPTGAATGIISGFAPGNTIGVSGVALDTASFNPDGTLTLGDNGTAVTTLTLAGSYGASTTFVTVNDGYGDDAVVVASGFAGTGTSGPSVGTSTSDNFTWQASAGGDWGTAANWLDNGVPATVAAGANDAVSFASTSTVFQVVRGQGNSRSIGVTGDFVLGGAFATGAFSVGTASAPADVVVVAGASVTASSVNVAYYSAVLNANGAGATVTVSGALTDSGGVVVTGGAKLTAASVSMTAFGEGIFVDSTGIVDIGGTGGTAGFLTVEAGAIISGYGAISAATINNGTVEASGSMLSITGAVTGDGTLLMAGSSPLLLNGSVAGSELITFGASSATLEVGTVLPSGGISGFAVSDVISFTTLAFNSLSYAPNDGGGTLTLFENGASAGALTLLGAQPAGTAFIVVPVPSYLTTDEIVLTDGTLGAGSTPPVAGTTTDDSYNWISTSGGAWGNVANWTDSSAGVTTSAPGANDSVAVSGSSGYFQAISGQGDAASLSVSGDFVLGGIFQVGSFTGGGFATIEIPAAATLTAGSGTMGTRALDIVGAGALMTSPGMLLFSNFGTVNVDGGGTLIAAGMSAASFTYVNVDSESAVEVGTADDPVTGAIVIDSGATVTGGVAFDSTLIDNGVIITGTSGITQLTAPVIGDGTIEISNGGQLYISSSVGANITIEFLGASGQLTVSNGGGPIVAADRPVDAGGIMPAPGINARILGYTAGDVIEVREETIDTAVFNPSGPDAGTLAIGENGAQAFALNLVGDYARASFAVEPPSFGEQNVLMSIACFAAGTKLLTRRGEIPVEQLRVGELISAEDAGDTPIKWIGHRHVDCRRHPVPRAVWPVRVRAGAYGGGVPHRDLWLSPGHAVFIDGVLIPVWHLINGTTIEQMPVDAITYYHIELDRHDVVLAEGMPVESYLDTGDRANFANGAGVVALHADFSAFKWEAEACAPLVVTGAKLDAARRQVATQRFEAAIHAQRLR